jgi:hypothetical protein
MTLGNVRASGSRGPRRKRPTSWAGCEGSGRWKPCRSLRIRKSACQPYCQASGRLWRTSLERCISSRQVMRVRPIRARFLSHLLRGQWPGPHGCSGGRIAHGPQKQTAPWCAAKEPSRLRKHTLERGPNSRRVPQHGYQKVNRGAGQHDIGGPVPHDITYHVTGHFLAAINAHSGGGSRARRTRLHAGPQPQAGIASGLPLIVFGRSP